MKAHQTLAALLMAGAVLLAGNAVAQDFSTRPVRLIVPFAPGGAVDVIARVISQKLTEAWGYQVVIDNHHASSERSLA